MKPRQRPLGNRACPTCGLGFALRVRRRKGGRTYVNHARWLRHRQDGTLAIRVYWPRDPHWYGAASKCPDPYHAPREPGLHPRPKIKR